MEFIELKLEQEDQIQKMSSMATTIVKEHFDPLIGSKQNDYMIQLFQTPKAIKEQLKHGYRYYFVKDSSKDIGFLALYPRGNSMYISKFYLYKEQRRKGYSHQMFQFVLEKAIQEGFNGIELNVNKYNSACKAYEKLGMVIIREEKNDIGNGFFMDDYVYRFDIKTKGE